MPQKDQRLVVDTSALLDGFNPFTSAFNDIVVPHEVLVELDSLKTRGKTHLLRSKVREAIRLLHRSKGLYKTTEGEAFQTADERILKLCVEASAEDKRLTVATSDISLHLQVDALGHYVLKDVAGHNKGPEVLKGYLEDLREDVATQLEENRGVAQLEAPEDHPEGHWTFLFLGRVPIQAEVVGKKLYLNLFRSTDSWNGGVNPSVAARNPEQVLALEALRTSALKIPLVVLLGPAGTGKTLLAAATAVESIVAEQQGYKTLYAARPVVPMGNQDVGFLPGELKDKLAPWRQPFIDNLRHVFGEHTQVEDKLAFLSLAHIRGRTFPDSILLIDEAQNLTYNELTTIITRAGENCKVVLIGDVAQKDVAASGLQTVIERFQDSSLCVVAELKDIERSPLAAEGVRRLLGE